jgi:hypothetical protein
MEEVEELRELASQIGGCKSEVKPASPQTESREDAEVVGYTYHCSISSEYSALSTAAELLEAVQSRAEKKPR